MVPLVISVTLGFLIQLVCGSVLDLQETRVYIRAVQCNVSEKFIFKNYSCFAKSYSRSISTINVVMTAKIPLDNIFLFAQVFYKYGVIYRQVMKSPLIDVCGIIDKYKNNVFVKHLIAATDAHAPGLIHECPYTKVDCRNITSKPESIPLVIPSGDYKYIQTYYQGDETIGSLNFIMNVNSPDKHSFG